MKTILAPTDLSENAQNALIFAIRMAKRTHSKLIFFYAQRVFIPVETPIRTYNELYKDYLKQYHNDLKKEVDKAFKKAKIASKEVEYDLIAYNSDDFVSGLCQAAVESQADLIVMGTKGASGLKKAFWGSNAVKMIQESPCPVWVIPAEWKSYECKKMVFASELKNTSEELNKVLALTRVLESHIDIIHVFPNDSDNINVEELNSKDLETQWQQQLNYQNLKFNLIKTEQTNQALIGIETFVKNQQPDGLILFPEKKTWLDKMFELSVTDSLVYSANLPLLVMK